MKHFLVVVFFLLISTFSYSQFLGLKISDAYSLIQQDSKNEIFKQGVFKDHYAIFWQNSESKILYSLYFDNSDISAKYYFTPRTSTDAVATASLYDHIHSKISSGHWYYIADNRVCYIDFIVNADKSYVFYVHY